MRTINDFLISTLGYEQAVMLQELITWIAGILLGFLLGILFAAMLTFYIKIDYELASSLTVIKMNRKKCKWIIANPKTIFQLIEAYCIALAWKLSREQDEVKLEASDLKRIRIIIITLLVAAAVLIFIALYLSLDIVLPDN